jgi:hypothetical protein
MATTAILPTIGNAKVSVFPRLARFLDVFANVFPHIPTPGMDSQHLLRKLKRFPPDLGIVEHR